MRMLKCLAIHRHFCVFLTTTSLRSPTALLRYEDVLRYQGSQKHPKECLQLGMKPLHLCVATNYQCIWDYPLEVSWCVYSLSLHVPSLFSFCLSFLLEKKKVLWNWERLILKIKTHPFFHPSFLLKSGKVNHRELNLIAFHEIRQQRSLKK